MYYLAAFEIEAWTQEKNNVKSKHSNTNCQIESFCTKQISFEACWGEFAIILLHVAFFFSVTKRKEGSGPFYILFKGRGTRLGKYFLDWLRKAVYWLLFALANTSYKTILYLTERSNPCMVIRLTALLYIDLM